MGGSNMETAPVGWVETEEASATDALADDTIASEWESVAAAATTVVLVGKTGNGKSATGNSILGENKLKSQRSHRSVTSTCELASAVKEDGRRVNVVDTPGLFDSTLPADQLVVEISRCIELAREGIHAILLVLSSRNRYSTEEMAAVSTLQTIFGEKVLNYMIIVLTGGDELEDEGLTLEEYFREEDGSTDSPLQDLVARCQNRKCVFNNKTKDERKLQEQTTELLRMVDGVVAANGGEPYSNALFKEAQELAATLAKQENLSKHIAESGTREGGEEERSFGEWKQELQESHARQLQSVTNMVEERLRVATEEQKIVLEERLAAETTAREKTEVAAEKAAVNAEGKMTKLRQELKEAQQKSEEMRERMERELRHKGCMIL